MNFAQGEKDGERFTIFLCFILTFSFIIGFI